MLNEFETLLIFIAICSGAICTLFIIMGFLNAWDKYRDERSIEDEFDFEPEEPMECGELGSDVTLMGDQEK